jgi:hypothetical protein
VHRVHFQFCGIWTRTCQEGAPAEVLNSGKDLKVVEHLGDKDCAEGKQKTEKSSRSSVELFQEGIERCTGCIEENSCEFKEKTESLRSSVELCQEGIEH